MAAALIGWAVGATAGEWELGDPPDEQGQRFNTSAYLKNHPMRTSRLGCKQEIARTCRFSVPGGMAIMSVSPMGRFTNTKEVVLIFARDSDPVSWVQAVDIFVGAYIKAKKDRQDVVAAIMKGVEPRKATIVRNDLRFTLSYVEGAGLFLHVIPAIY